MIEVNHSKLSLARQCELVSIARSSHYYRPKNESEFNLELIRLIDKQYLKTPWYGSRQMRRFLRRITAIDRNRFSSRAAFLGRKTQTGFQTRH